MIIFGGECFVEDVVVLHPEINNEIKMRMKQRILHNAKGYVLGGLAIVAATLMSCSNKENRYVFNNAQDAVTTCHQELAMLRPMASANIEELAGLTANWIELQDSTMNVMMRDSTLRNDAVLTRLLRHGRQYQSRDYATGIVRETHYGRSGESKD